jgi:hypothetical protein
MKSFLLSFFFLLFSQFNLFAQLDTIGGPFVVTNAVVASEEKIYVAASPSEFEPVKIYAYDGDILNDPGTIIFENPFASPIGSMVVEGEDLYFVSSGEFVSEGLIYKISNINSDEPSTEVYLNLPWLPTNLVIRDEIMYISKFYFFGGGIFTYDMGNPDAQLENFIGTNANSLTDFAILGDELLITDGSDGRLLRVDLSAETPSLTTLITGLDFPTSIAVDEDLLYLSVKNQNSNLTSRVNIYDFATNVPGDLVLEVADNTNLSLAEIERFNGLTYVLEFADGNNGLGYLLRVDNPTSTTSPIFSDRKIDVFPNPTSGLVYFPTTTAKRVDVFNVKGQRVISFTDGAQQLELSALPKGLYTLLFFLEDDTLGSVRLVKQ